jgi:hypothetical protein
MTTRATRGSSAARAAAAASVVGLELDHRPHDHPGGRQHVLEQWKLREQIGLDACARLVSGPQVVAERFDHVIRCYGNVARAGVDHAEDGRHHASHRPDLAPLAVAGGRERVEVAKQFVGTVDKVDVQ